MRTLLCRRRGRFPLRLHVRQQPAPLSASVTAQGDPVYGWLPSPATLLARLLLPPGSGDARALPTPSPSPCHLLSTNVTNDSTDRHMTSVSAAPGGGAGASPSCTAAAAAACCASPPAAWPTPGWAGSRREAASGCDCRLWAGGLCAHAAAACCWLSVATAPCCCALTAACGAASPANVCWMCCHSAVPASAACTDRHSRRRCKRHRGGQQSQARQGCAARAQERDEAHDASQHAG